MNELANSLKPFIHIFSRTQWGHFSIFKMHSEIFCYIMKFINVLHYNICTRIHIYYKTLFLQ